jgi:hypothetical protein
MFVFKMFGSCSNNVRSPKKANFIIFIHKSCQKNLSILVILVNL